MTRPSSRLKQAVLLAAVLALARFWIAGRLDLAEDEAYYWEWSRSLAWGYYDQGPGLALAIRLGTWLLGPTEQGVRLVSVLGGFAISCLGAWITASVFGLEDMALWAVGAFNGCLIFAVGGVMMMHDSLMVLGWALCTAGLLLALRRHPRWWIAAGLGAATALLCKYTAVLLVGCMGLCLAAIPGLRRQAKTPWPWLGMALACLGGLPLLVWNEANGWPSFQHIGSLAGGDASRRRGLPFLELPGSQFGLVTPLLFVVVLSAWVWAWRRWRRGEGRDEESVLLFTSLPVALFFQALAFHTRVEGNWPACAYFGGLLLGGLWLKARRKGPGRLAPASLWVAWAMTVLMFWQALAPFLPFPKRVAHWDAPARMDGWKALGARTWRERQALGPGAFTAVCTYQNAGEEAFYQPGQERAAMLVDSPPGNEYRFWDTVSGRAGRNAVLVAGQDWEIRGMAVHFQRIVPLPDEVLVRNGNEVRRTHLALGYGFKD